MSIHPLVRSEQPQGQGQATDPLQGFSEQFWVDEDEHARPPPVWVGVVVLTVLGLVFVAGFFVGGML